MTDTLRRPGGGPASARPDSGDDATLIARSVRAPECFGELFGRHADAIGRYITSRLGPDAADDLVAETFLVAFRRRGRYDGADPDARPWLFGIATRLVRQHRRDEDRFFRAIARTGIDAAAGPSTEEATDRIAAQAASRELAAALAMLSPAQRDVLLLVASGLGYAEAARALAVPVGTVSSRLVRARQKVREALGGQDPTDPGEDGPR
ncbi:MAG TPA: RNA polymerase sigma factor [Streptosporangiaceae bacterium]|nr:RNA polymerase sigma factor [Streptosporangiaceae bacterium]